LIEYQITSWLKSTFSYRGTVLPRILLRVLCLLLLTAALIVWAGPWVRQLHLNALGHTLIGTALGFVLVFRNNASYDRYWEGRKHWGGIVNASRNLARSARSYSGDLSALAPLICAFAHSLKRQLRREGPRDDLTEHLGEARAARALKHPNPALVVNLMMSEWLHAAESAGKVSHTQALRMEALIAELMDHQGACERILNTPVPFAHAVHVRQLLLIYLISLPLVLIPLMGWTSLFVISVLGLGMLGIEEAGIEIEDPFGHDPNDLPLNRICDVICRDVRALVTFEREGAPPPTAALSASDESTEAHPPRHTLTPLQ
jgi:putative membrane protein